MARSIRELISAAQQQRQEAIEAGRDLSDEEFRVDEIEREILTYTPLTAASHEHISEDRTRICGLRIVIAGASRVRRRRR